MFSGPDPPCLPPKAIIDGVCQKPKVPEAPVVNIRPEVPTFVDEPDFEDPILPEPPRPIVTPRPLAPLPTLPPEIAEETFTPPVITNSFQVL